MCVRLCGGLGCCGGGCVCVCAYVCVCVCMYVRAMCACVCVCGAVVTHNCVQCCFRASSSHWEGGGPDHICGKAVDF